MSSLNMSSHHGDDLLKFLIDVSNQIELLLNHRQRNFSDHLSFEHQQYEHSVFRELKQGGLLQNKLQISKESQAFENNYLEHNYGAGWICGYDYPQSRQSLSGPVNETGTTNCYGLPAASPNFIYSTQGPFKSFRSRDMDYLYNGEVALAHAVMQSDFQPDCAYCQWLATTSTQP